MKGYFASSEKRLLLIGGLLFVALCGGGIVLSQSHSGQLDIPAPLPTPIPNGFDLYVAAANAIVPANPPVDQINDRVRRSPQEVAQLYTPARRSAWIASNAKTWALFRLAQMAQSRHPNVRGVLMPTTPYAPLRELARCKVIEATEFKSRDQWDKALDSGLDTLKMGHDIEHGAPLIGGLVGLAISAIGLRSNEDVPSHLTAKQARNGIARLEAIMAGSAKPSEILSEEKWNMQTLVLNHFGSKPNILASIVMPAGRTAASIGAMADGFIAEIDKPLRSQKTPPPPTGLSGVQTAMYYPIFVKCGFNWARRSAQDDQLLLRLALRAYRLEKSAYPTALTQLAPRYLKKVPMDPFGSGEQWHYKRAGDSYGDSYKVWSIGPDGKDDGGTSIAPKSTTKRVVIANTSLGDYVARP